MIYEFLGPTVPIRQGDIFIGLPRIDLSLEQVLLMDEEGQRIAKWEELANQNGPFKIIVPARPVASIVATQDCDAYRTRDITLCEI